MTAIITVAILAALFLATSAVIVLAIAWTHYPRGFKFRKKERE